MRLLRPDNAPVGGRGASHNPGNRFERLSYELDPESLEDDEDIPRPRTEYYRDVSRSILATNDSPDIGFDFSLNPYRGCEHGCVYCYARPSHEFLGMSAGLDFETKIMVKEDAPDLLRKELSRKKWQPQTVVMGGVTDPYQPIEKKLEITRGCLEVFAEFRNPVAIITKNHMVTRDIDLLKDLAADNAAMVSISLTTLDLSLNRILEPRTSSPAQRLKAIEQLSAAGIPVGVMTAPLIPAINDMELPKLLQAAADAGAVGAGYVMLRLPLTVAPLFEQWLTEHFPDRKDKVLHRVRETRGGQLYQAKWGTRMKGEGVYADSIRNLFEIGCRKAGLAKRPGLSAAAFKRPLRSGDQLGLF